jgi:hypothetical protein
VVALVLAGAASAGMAAVASAGPVASATSLKCKSADLRYPFMPGGPNDFGVFALRVAGGRCGTAHRVANDWMKRFETALSAGHVRVPHQVDGFTFKTLPATQAQQYREQGSRGSTTIRFDYFVPNG